jgi:hypothetical protein
MIWANRNVPSVQQIEITSTDITAVLIPADKPILAISAYVPPIAHGEEMEALVERLALMGEAISRLKERHGATLEVIVTGDFNRHHLLWGGNEVVRQRKRLDEADPIIHFMADFGLQSLLPRGTITFAARSQRSTIDLVLASEGLTTKLNRCQIHPVEHGSDHRAIQSVFDTTSPASVLDIPKWLVRQADWGEVRRHLSHLNDNPVNIETPAELEQQSEVLIQEVTRALDQVCPKSKSSPYCKRWWTAELTALRKEYTRVRNQCTRSRGYGCQRPDLEEAERALRQRFHTAIRDQKRKHWNDFLQDAGNIWKAAKYLSNRSGSTTVPTLRTSVKMVERDEEKAQVLLSSFFPPLPPIQEEEQRTTAERPSSPLPFEPLTHEEVGSAIRGAQSWKAPGQDGLPMGVWQEAWPAVGKRIFQIFEASLRLGCIPESWRTAKIVVLHKFNKDRSLPKSYRPISLLPTLAKAMETVVAKRISYLVEKYQLLPANHFGARSRRSCEQALNVLVEKIYDAWRSGNVLSLVSFDVKGAYNGVSKEVLLRRLSENRLPECLIRWISCFCTERRARIVVNKYCSEVMPIDHAGLPQGSPLSPILFLFINARLVKVRITDKKGAIAFVDDYTHWVVGPSAEANTTRLQARIIPRALQWARESGALFEPEKTSFIHFTRNPRLRQQPAVPLWIEGSPVLAQSAVKLLGVVLDQELRFRLHGAMAAKKGIQAALALKRLKGLTPKAARQLFTSTVTATVDYAASVWCTPTRDHLVPVWVTKTLRAAQKIAAQAIVGLFRTVSLLIAESEASIESINIRLGRRILRHWISCHTLPSTHPFWECREAVANQKGRYFFSPFRLLAVHCCLQKMEVETILPTPLDPRKPTLREYITTTEGEFNDRRDPPDNKARLEIFTHSAAHRGVIAVGFVARVHNATVHSWHQAVGSEERMNVYYGQLGAIYEAATYVKTMIPKVSMAPSSIRVTFVTNNRTVLDSLTNPGNQSGQSLLCQIINVIFEIVERGTQVELRWLAAHDLTEGNVEARSLLNRRLDELNSLGSPPWWANTQLRSTLWSEMRRKISKAKMEEFKKRTGGKFTRAFDSALPGKHTRLLYDGLNRQEAALLAQLRTGHNGLRGFLSAIQQSDTETCACGEETESVRHFLFQCTRWDHLRNDMIQAMGDRFGDLSFALGGRSGQVGTDGKPVDGDPSRWKPNLEVVRAVLRFARNTGRLVSETPTGVQMQRGRYQEEIDD